MQLSAGQSLDNDLLLEDISYVKLVTTPAQSITHHPRSPNVGLECRLVNMPVPNDFQVSDAIDYELSPISTPIPFLHMHDSLEVGYCYEGTGILLVEDRVMSFQAGDVSIVNRMEMHMSRGANDTLSRWTYFWTKPVPLLATIPESLAVSDQAVLGGPDFPNIISPHSQPGICRVVPMIIDELRAKGPGYRMAVKGLMATLMALLHRMCKHIQAESTIARSGIERISPALQHMAAHCAEPIDVEELAALCHLSVPHFRRLFVSAMGSPPLQYLAQLRVRLAAGILREQPHRPITEVAFAVGFESINTFNRQFHQTVGVSPRQWRQHVAKK
jgi:AraC-like DNA-binding protein